MVGTKAGMLELYDLGSSSLVESVKGHSGAVYSMQMRPDKRGFVTGGADKDVKFWDFKLDESVVRLPIVHSYTHMHLINCTLP